MQEPLAEITVNYGGSVSMKFTYELNGIGWANVELKLNHKECCFFPSYITDALSDLVQAIEVLMPECVAEDEVRSASTFTWNSEPAEHLWVLTRKDKETLNLQIRLYRDGVSDGKYELILDEDCFFDEFVKELVGALEEILYKHGIVGYKKQWCSGEFPLSGYIMLKHYLLRKKEIEIKIHNEDEWNEFYQSNLEEEIKLVLKTT